KAVSSPDRNLASSASSFARGWMLTPFSLSSGSAAAGSLAEVGVGPDWNGPPQPAAPVGPGSGCNKRPARETTKGVARPGGATPGLERLGGRLQAPPA